MPPDQDQGTLAADYLVKGLKATTVYSVDDKSDYGTGLSGVLDPELTKDGAQVTHVGIAPTKNYQALAGTIAQAKPSAVYYSGYYSDFALFLKALNSAGYQGIAASGDGSDDPHLIALAGAAANNVYLTCPCSDPNVDPADASFVSAYTALAHQYRHLLGRGLRRHQLHHLRDEGHWGHHHASHTPGGVQDGELHGGSPRTSSTRPTVKWSVRPCTSTR